MLASLAFIIWMLFFDRHDVATQYEYYSQLKGLKREKAFYTREIERVNKAIHDLNVDPQALERIARERYMMKRENEDVFVILEQTE